ncbi:fumarate reductase subunit C [Klebsiella pneumoniae]|nr:fumarate reductase subunit C [Klebsiella pneumoniae]
MGCLPSSTAPRAGRDISDSCKNPVVVILNLITLAAALLHTKTWFGLAPKAANVIIKGEKMGPEPVIKGLWVVTAVVTVVILFVALFW